MIRKLIAVISLALVTACSDSGADQAAIDAAVEKALADRERNDAAKYRALGQDETGKNVADADMTDASASAARPVEQLRDGLPTGMGSPYGMCIRTLSIVGEQCGCMVNRAMDAGIGGPALVGLFGGDGKRAAPPQIDTFKQIVRACANYNITVQGSNVAANGTPNDALAGPAPVKSTAGERTVRCEFYTTRANYNGPCRFLPGKGGDFRAISTDGAFSEADGIYRIDLDVTGTNVGSLVIDGGYEPYVVAVSRSQTDRACWTSAEATFCAR